MPFLGLATSGDLRTVVSRLEDRAVDSDTVTSLQQSVSRLEDRAFDSETATNLQQLSSLNTTSEVRGGGYICVSANDVLAGALGAESVPYTRDPILLPFAICAKIDEGVNPDLPGAVDASQLTCAAAMEPGVHICGATLKDALLGQLVYGNAYASLKFDFLESQLSMVQEKLGALDGSRASLGVAPLMEAAMEAAPALAVAPPASDAPLMRVE